MKSHLAILVFASILFTKCSNNNISEETVDHGDTTVLKIPLQLDQESITAQMRDSVWKLAFPPKAEKIRILTELLKSNKMPEANFALLQQLLNEQSYDSSTLALLFSYEAALSPIYLYDNQQQIVSLFSDSKFMPVFKEHNLLEVSIKTKSLAYDWAPSYYESIEYYSFLWDSISETKTPDFYTFSLKERSKNTIDNIGQELTDCSWFCLFPLKNNKPNLLFSSPFALDLEYVASPTIGQFIKKQSKYYWGDCPNNLDQEKVFAKLRGVDGVYFTHVDEGKDGAQPDWDLYPMRSLIYVNNKNQVKHIWTSDLYEQTCSCL